MKQRTEYVVESVIRREGEGQNRQQQPKEQYQSFFHVMVWAQSYIGIALTSQTIFSC